MSETHKKKTGVFVWGVMGLLVLGLGGFGLTGAFQTSGGSVVATIGDEEISADEYLSGLQQDLRRASQQFGENLTIAQARAIGIDQSSLRRQVTLAALSNEAKRLNISVGDLAVRDALLANPNFQAGGIFSEATYDLVLNQQRITRTEYENLLREDQTQNLISGAISGGIGKQDTAARILMDFLGETRNITWAEIDASVLASETEAPGEPAIQAYYDANPAAFTTPETRKITYAMLTPEMLAGDIEITDAAIAEVFDARKAFLNTPARRIVDRIIFPDMESAAAANEKIASGAATFDDIAAERGLTAEETSVGLVRAAQLSSDAAALLFGSEETGIYGPVQATLGPAIFRVKAALPEKIVALEDVRDDIRNELANEQAASLMLTKIGGIDDLIASGATPEELANETEMQLFNIDYNAESTDEITTDPAFTAEALAADVGEERDIVELENGGIIALRVDEIVPARLLPLEEARDQAIAGALAAATQKRVEDYAAELAAQVEAGADLGATLAAIGITPHNVANVTRTAPPEDLPPSVGLGLFDQAEGEIKTYPAGSSIIVLQIDSVMPFDPESESGKTFMAQAEEQINGDIASDAYILFANGIVANTEISINQGMIDRILASFSQ